MKSFQESILITRVGLWESLCKSDNASWIQVWVTNYWSTLYPGDTGADMIVDLVSIIKAATVLERSVLVIILAENATESDR